MRGDIDTQNFSKRLEKTQELVRNLVLMPRTLCQKPISTEDADKILEKLLKKQKAERIAQETRRARQLEKEERKQAEKREQQRLEKEERERQQAEKRAQRQQEQKNSSHSKKYTTTSSENTQH